MRRGLASSVLCGAQTRPVALASTSRATCATSAPQVRCMPSQGPLPRRALAIDFAICAEGAPGHAHLRMHELDPMMGSGITVWGGVLGAKSRHGRSCGREPHKQPMYSLAERGVMCYDGAVGIERRGSTLGCYHCGVMAGTYSLGGVVRYERFVDIDPTIFRTSCTYKTLVPGSTTELQTLNCTQG